VLIDDKHLWMDHTVPVEQAAPDPVAQPLSVLCSPRGDVVGVQEHQLNEVLMEFAETLCTDFSVADILQRTVIRTSELLDVSGAGVVAVANGDDLHFVAASNDVVSRIEDVQRGHAEGPCHTAHRTGRAVAVPDLAIDTSHAQFSRAACRAGMRAVFAFPLCAGGHRLGALDLYRDTPGPLSAQDARIATVLADVAAAYLVNARARSSASRVMAELNHRSLHDPLTGLPNRALLAELLTEALARAKRSRRRLAVMFLDLDGFKGVNDRFGHHVGDQLLVAVAARLTGALRPGDTLARLGGDEFVAVCEDLSEGSRAADVAHRLLAAMATPFAVHGQQVELSTSIGIALSDRRSPPTAGELLTAADEAMYQAKRGGGDRHHVYQPAAWSSSPEEPASSVGGLEPRPRGHSERTPASTQPGRESSGSSSSWDHEPFGVAYQPITCLSVGKMVAAEALLRWHDGLAGATAPDGVVGEAERSGAILGLGEWVLRRACTDSARWSRPGVLTTVNVSAQQITGPAFVRTVDDVLQRTGADPTTLCLELTESSTLPDDRRTVDVLRGLKDLGVHLWLDDFGSGYSSLHYLRVFPIDAVKIEPGFAARLPRDKASRVIIGSVIDMAHALGMTVVVEGIENAEEMHAAQDLDADYGQGFHLARPLSALDLSTFTPPPSPRNLADSTA
jgi:diguanylate cyclase (GGDEF)-like protein